MAQLTFFNPDTGEKLGEAKGTVRWGNPQADPVQQLIDMQERMMKCDEQPKLQNVTLLQMPMLVNDTVQG